MAMSHSRGSVEEQAVTGPVLSASGSERPAARLWLQFEDRSGETVVRLKQQQPPWRVIRAFQTSSGEALTHLNNVSGGVLDNDNLRLRVDVGPHARAQITTTGSTRVYRSRSADAISRQRTEVTVGEGGFLEFLPDPVIPYAHSRFEQSAIIQLADSSTLFWWETIAPGREAAGEVFAYHNLSSSLEIRSGGQPVAIERFAIEPALRDPRSPARLGSFRYLSSFYICQVGLGVESWLDLESRLGDLAGELSRPAEVLWGVSALTACGLMVRGVAVRGRDLTCNLPKFWAVAKWALCGRVAAIPRKIY
jgi:urease accessory protein